MIGNTKKFNIEKVCVILMCTYLFLSYVAVNVWLSYIWVSISLYAFLGIGALYVFISVLTTKKFKITVYSWWYLAFIAISIFSMIYSPTEDLFSGIFYRMIISFVLTYLYGLLINSKTRFRIFAWTIVLGSLLLDVMLIMEGKFTGDAGERLGQEVMGNANAFARMIMTAVLMGAWLLFCDSAKNSYKNELLNKCWLILKIILIVSILLNMYAIAMAASRSYFVIPFIFIYILIVYNKKSYKVLIYSLIFMAVIVFVYNSIMNVPELYNAIGIRFEKMIDGLLGTGIADKSTTMRNKMREVAFLKWLEKPIFGYGFDSFKYWVLEAVGDFYYSHCNYTELLYSGGIITFVIYYWIYYRLFKQVINAKNAPVKYKAFAVALIIAFLVFDYASIMYDAAISQVMLVLAYRGLGFKKDEIYT